MALTHRCPIVSQLTQLYLCRTCRTVWGTFDMSLRGAPTTAGAAENERSDK